MADHPQTRRRFIAKVVSFIAFLLAITHYLTPRKTSKRKLILSAKSVDVPLNGALVYKNERVALMRNVKEISALSLECTHLGCTVLVTENGFSCPCHGSRFNAAGAVIVGPAIKPLVKLSLVVEEGIVKVYGV